ncbi:uncharacterized protein [Choristoneura fumiferana]|uniref:uncharacterized protein n=1 Tax=Choristoneura fumiferana TaxID=7141 RepID=UPI003D159BF4
MEVQVGPNAHDEPHLLYKLQRKVKVFNTNNLLPNRGYNLVASVSKYGIVFIGLPDGNLAVYYLKQLIDKECDPQHMLVQLQENPTHISVSCDQELLAVTGGQLLVVYKVVDFQNQNVSPALSVKCDVNPSTFVSDLKWNPCIPDTIAIAFYDGTLTVLQASTGQVKKVQSKARCICWSPKGKQLVVGNSDGTLYQYKPDLSPMKSVPAPNIFQGSPVEALAIHWISTYQFAVVYRNAADNSRPAVTIVNTPKAGQPTCLNYEDICYSMGSNRPWYYYLHGVAQWNIILCSSSNSMEMATLGTADGANWLQWCQPDEARPELPLTDKKQENYPVGICFDTAAIHQLPWGENEKLPPMPMLHVVSQTGLLTIFNVINLNRQSPLITAQPQMLTLPAGAMVSAEVEPVSNPPAAPALAAALQAKPAQPLLPTPQPAQAVSAPAQFGLTTNTASKPFSAPQPQNQPAFTTIAAPQPQANEPKPPETKPAVVVPTPTPAPQPQAQPKPAPTPQKDQTQELNAALKAEQELVNKQKANQELKSMLIREVNEFQMELYKFVTKTRQAQIQFHRELQAISPNSELQNLDADAIKKDCSLEDLRNAIITLKLDLVRACAVVAEARTHSDAKDLDQWTQADPLTTKRVASVKKLAYYVQSQLEQAHRALDYKWNQQAELDMKLKKPGHRMIRPILDDVYQPLVRQQEILSRQQALLKTLRSTLNECNVTPAFKTTSILRTTPFKKDPLSKLTKNILNMSIEPQSKENKNLLTSQKLDALRDMLSNHKTVKIKPVNVEMRHHLTAMRMSYEKSLKEKANETKAVKVEPKPAVQNVSVTAPPVSIGKKETTLEVKPPLLSQPPTQQMPITVKKTTAPQVVRTLFTEEPKPEPAKQVQAPVIPKQPLTFATPTAAPVNTRSVLKDLLQNKQVTIETKKDDNENTFMGQKICSPSSAFNFSSVIVATPTSFTSKPISELNNMFTKFAPQAFVPESKSSETGETNSLPLKVDAKKEEKPMSNLFAMRTSTPLQATQNVPDVLGGNSKTFTFKRVEPKAEPKLEPKPDKVIEKSKENVPEKASGNVILSIPKVTKEEKNENETKPLSTQNTNKQLFGSNTQPTASSPTPSDFTSDEVPKPIAIKSEIKTEAFKVVPKSETAQASSSSIFATASATITVPKPQSIFGSSAVSSSTPAVVSQTVTIAKPQPTSSASSIFATAVASSPLSSPTKTEPAIFSAAATTTTVSSPTKTESTSIFATASTTPSSVFGSSTSIFGTTTTTQSSVFATTSATEAKPTESVFSSTASTASSIFGSTAKSVFGTSAFATTTTTTAAPVFAAPTSTPSSDIDSTPSSTPTAFATVTSTTQSGFGSTITTTPSVFGTPASSPSIFGAPTSTTQPSVFGGTQTSVFGSPQTSQASIFGTPATTQASVFGTPATTQTSVFGTPTTQASVFGSPATTQTSVFGTPTTQTSMFGTPTTQASVFGTPTSTNQTPVFGASQPSVFGAAATQSSVFGTPTQTNQASVFGTPTQTTQASVFGTPPATQASVFGSSAQITQASVFGSPAQTSVFGAPATTASGSLFGGGESLFASVNISTTSAPSQSSESIFGGGSSGTSVFGNSNTNVFGSKATFGQPNTQASAIFGGSSTFGQTSAAPATNFWGSNNNSGGGFGSTGFGQQATTQASSVFGTGSFSAPSAPGQAFGAGDSKPFGSPTQQTGGFGSGFGAKATFGQPASFGSPTSSGFGASAFGGFNKSPGGFGTSATFGGAAFGGSGFGGGSPGSVFGGAASQPSFGSPTQSNATFESLATQNTLTFGNLAQQSPQQAQPAPSFNTSPSFTGWRG